MSEAWPLGRSLSVALAGWRGYGASAPGPSSPIAYIDAARTVVSSTTGPTVNNATASEGDLLINVFATSSVHNSTGTPPTGWSKVLEQDGDFDGISIFTKIATASEPATTAWTSIFDAFENVMVMQLVYRNVDETTPIEASASGTTGFTTAVDFGTTSVSNDAQGLTVIFANPSAASTSITWDSGDEERIGLATTPSGDNGTSHSLHIADRLIETAGAFTLGGDASSSNTWVTAALALKKKLSGAVSTTVSHGDTDFTLVGSITNGIDVNGKPWALYPSGSVDITSITPAQTTDGSGDIINGAMLNPTRTSDSSPDQGFDERLNGWNAADNETGTISVSAGDVVVKTTAHDPHVNRDGAFDEVAALHVLSSAPTGEYVLGSSIGWAGKSTPAYYNIDIDSWYSARTVYSSTSVDFPTYSVLYAALSKFNPITSFRWSSGDQSYENFAPYQFAGTNSNNYGQYVSQMMGTALLALSSDVYTEEEVKNIARKVIQHGIEWGDPMLYDGEFFDADGGIWQYFQGAITFALYMTGRSSEIDDIMTACPGNWEQAFKVTADQVANDFVQHSDLTKPAMWRSRTLSTQPGGATLSIPYNASPNQGDYFRSSIPAGAIATRPSDGQTAIVATSTPLAPDFTTSTGFLDVELTGTNPFSSGDVIYFEAPSGWINTGDYEWTINGLSESWQMYSPSAANGYRDLQTWFAQIMALRGLGICKQSAFEDVQGYCERAEVANDPASGNDYDSLIYNWDSYTTARDTYTQHWTALAAQTQIT